MDHIGLDPALPQKARQPNTVATRLEGHRDPVDPAAGLHRLGPPAIHQRHKSFLIAAQPLQRLTLKPGNKARHKPALQTQLDHRNQRPILIKGDEGLAQIIPWHGALHYLLENDDGAIPSSPPHRIFSRSGEGRARGRRPRAAQRLPSPFIAPVIFSRHFTVRCWRSFPVTP